MGTRSSSRRNPDYWGAKPFFQDVTLKYFKDPTALNNALLTGTIDVIGTVQAPESLTQFEGNDKYEITEGTTNGEVVLSFNNGKAPMNDLKVRQAVRYAIDHQALLDTCWAGRGTLIGSMVPPTDPWYEDLTGLYPYDVEKAKALVAETGVAAKPLRLRVPVAALRHRRAGRSSRASSSRPASRSHSTSSSSRPCGSTTVFTDADYDMSIVAHVEPRDLPPCSATPSTTRATTTSSCRPTSPRPTPVLRRSR